MDFKKLALVSAIAAAPMGAMAMQPMQDSALSNVTGRDGISISLATNVTAGLKIHDTDGLATTSGGTGNSGAMVINGFSITRNAPTDTIDLAIDADAGAGATNPFLNIAVTLPNNLTVNMGSLGVADSGRSGASTDPWTTSNTVASVVTLGAMTLGTTTLNIQLGNEPQGHMIALNTSISNGIKISGFSVKDSGGTVTGGALTTDLQILDTGSTAAPTLTVNTGIDLGTDGLHVGLSGIGGASGMDVRMANLSLDNGGSTLGDVELTGLQLTGDLIVNGH